MIATTAAPREHLRDEQVRSLISDGDLDVDVRVELLDLDDRTVADISEDVSPDGSVTWNGSDAIHRSCDLTLRRALAWDRDRLRISLLLASPVLGLAATFPLGIFIPTRPSLEVDDAVFADGTSAPAHRCKGWDKLRVLRRPMARSWATAWTETGQATTFGAEAARLLAAARWRGPVVIDPILAAALLPEPTVWPNDGSGTAWLVPLAAMAAAVGGAPPWVDETGALRLELLADPATRSPEWVLDAQHPATIVGPRRTRTQDLSTLPNCWMFIAQNWPRTPVIGDGIYIPPANTSTGPASIAARGFEVWNEGQMLDATSQDALVAQGDARRAADLRALGVREVSTAPLPLMGHDDLYEVADLAFGGPVRALATTWTQRWDGTDSSLTLEEVT